MWLFVRKYYLHGIHEIWENLAWEINFFGRFPWFWMHVFKLGVFFIARFFHLDIKVIIARDENCMFSYQTFLRVARNWEHNNCLFLPFFILLKNEKLKESISCNNQESIIRRYAIFSSFNNYLSHVNRRGVLSKNANQRNGFHGEVLHTIGD